MFSNVKMGAIIALSIIPWLPMTEAYDPMRDMFDKISKMVNQDMTDGLSLVYTTSTFIAVSLLLVCTTKRNRRLGQFTINGWLLLFMISWILRLSKVI